MNLFNPQYLLPLLGKMAETYIHHTVQLSDGDRGEVVMIHQQSLASPVVRVDNTFIDLAKSDALKIVKGCIFFLQGSKTAEVSFWGYRY